MDDESDHGQDQMDDDGEQMEGEDDEDDGEQQDDDDNEEVINEDEDDDEDLEKQIVNITSKNARLAEDQNSNNEAILVIAND